MSKHSKAMSGYNECELHEFMCYVIHEKRNILVDSKRDPCQILIDVFDLCIDNFDRLDLQEKQSELYDCLMQLYNSNQKKLLMDSLEENISNIYSLLDIFSEHKDKIKSVDPELYYALLNFIDMLKGSKGKHIYNRRA